MDRREYLRALDEALAALVPAQERAEMLRYYEEYFDEAGPDGEAAVMADLGDPRDLAQALAAEAGFAPRNKGRHKGRTGLLIALVAAGSVGLMVLVVAILIFNFAAMVDHGVDVPVTDGVIEYVENVAPVDGHGEDGFEGQPFREVRVDADVADVTIERGGGYSLRLRWAGGDDYRLSYELDGETLTVTSSRQDGNNGNISASVTITLPQGAALEEVTLDTALGDILLDGVSAGQLSCDTGLGEIRLIGVEAPSVDADTGLGDILWEGSLSRDTDLDTGMGDIVIEASDAGRWGYDLSTAMGNVTVNGKDMGDSAEKNGDGGELSASSGMGDVTLLYRDTE